ncbi:MAG: dTMP kinase [Nitrosomonadales bacterium]|jgi:dTMP kinase|nr:dTMP kinase [Nitrosomonadales bacterium]MBT5149657.1 dTMP kinase [Nitrosomonadales bacterium]MBT5572988.1 dTMP kinase [Nitrosomonadales bacterium]MBT6014353.1 dTMP kinase [Nitrosomonadales bacterium]MBT6251316.1 dTMP kinase [Nitrosomonadales bacterium]
MNNLGKFITLEGVDGAGKTTHIEFIKNYLSDLGIHYVMTREPGGTLLGERLRDILLHDEMTPETETMLMFAARNEHIDKVIRPNLLSGAVVISDRFTDASYAYQAGGKGVKEEKIDILKNWVQGSLQPDLTFLFDLPVEISMERLKKTRNLDKFERENKNFHENIRKKYLMLANACPERFVVLDSQKSIEEIQCQIKLKLDEALK